MSNNSCFTTKRANAFWKFHANPVISLVTLKLTSTSREYLTFLWTTLGHAGDAVYFRSLEDALLFVASPNSTCYWQCSTAAPSGKGETIRLTQFSFSLL